METTTVRYSDNKYAVKQGDRTLGFVSRTLLANGEKRFIGTPLCAEPATFEQMQSAVKYVEMVFLG